MSPSFSLGTGLSISTKVRFGNPYVDYYSIGEASPELVASFTLKSDNSTEGEYFRKAGSDTTFGDLFTFARTGSAWYFNSSGVLTEATSGNARRNAYYYNGSAWVKGGLRLESAAATNLLPYSKDFTNGAWNKANVTVALDAGDVYEVTESGTGSQTPYVFDSASTSITPGNYCIAVDVKDVDRGYAYLQWTDGTNNISNRFSINVDLSDGSVTDTDTVNSPSVIGYGASPNGDGWYRLWISVTTAGPNGFLVVGPSDSDTPSWTAIAVPQYTVSGKKIHIRYAQLEAGSIPSSFIPTNGSTVTRAAETLEIAQANYPTADNATPHWFVLDIRMWDEDTRQDWFNLDNVTGFRIRQENQRSRILARTVADGQEGVATLIPSGSAYELFDARYAHRFTASEHGGAANGGSYASISLTEVPAVPTDDLNFTADEFNGFIRQFYAGIGEPSPSELETVSA